jgi:hypothetical protein
LKNSASPSAACPLPVPESQARRRAGATLARYANSARGYEGRAAAYAGARVEK